MKTLRDDQLTKLVSTVVGLTYFDEAVLAAMVTIVGDTADYDLESIKAKVREYCWECPWCGIISENFTFEGHCLACQIDLDEDEDFFYDDLYGDPDDCFNDADFFDDEDDDFEVDIDFDDPMTYEDGGWL